MEHCRELPEEMVPSLPSHDFSIHDLTRVARAIRRCQLAAEEQNCEAGKILDLIDLKIFNQAEDQTAVSADATMPSTKIRTRGGFSFMELPAELRLKICGYILISPCEIAIPPKAISDSKEASPLYPPVAILRTCKLLNEEATPLLYARNNFNITLPNPQSRFDDSFPLLSTLRWATIDLLPRLTFTSFTQPGEKISPACFICTGADILAQFKPGDFRLSPIGMDKYHVRHAWNWISCEVMKKELAAFQKEWKELMEPAGFEMPQMEWDPASLYGIQDVPNI